VTEFDDRIKKY